ncbi:MAG TPA: hypothetical protein VGA88_10585 [Burkholderiales bacterium]
MDPRRRFLPSPIKVEIKTAAEEDDGEDSGKWMNNREGIRQRDFGFSTVSRLTSGIWGEQDAQDKI